MKVRLDADPDVVGVTTTTFNAPVIVSSGDRAQIAWGNHAVHQDQDGTSEITAGSEGIAELLAEILGILAAAELTEAQGAVVRRADADALGETTTATSNETLDFDELAEDIAIEIRQIKAIDAEIDALDDRIAALYEAADPAGIVASAPGIGVVLAAGILARTGDLNRFENLAGVRSFTGLVPKVDQSDTSEHHSGPTKSGDLGLRQALFLAADLARKVDPTLAARYQRLYVDNGKHHNSAICTIAAVLITRIAASWRNGQLYELRDTDGRLITQDEGGKRCSELYKIDAATRAARNKNNTAAAWTGRRGKGVDQSRSSSQPV
ncbi:MAG: transposase [Microthrixaceae bacterium]